MTKIFLNAGSSGPYGWHSTELAVRCLHLFALRHRSGDRHSANLNGLDRPPLLKGSLGHAGLAHHYVRLQAEQEGLDSDAFATPDEAIDACAIELGRYAPPFIEQIKSAIESYIAHWVMEDLEVLHVEEVFSLDVGAGSAPMTMRLDLVVRERSSGKVVIFDHKFVGRLGKTVDRYTLSGQFLGLQTIGQSVWGKEFGGVRMNLVELGDGGSFRFRREMPDPAPAALKAFPLTVLNARQRVAQLDADKTPVQQWPRALSEQTCITAYGRCDAFDLCRWGS